MNFSYIINFILIFFCSTIIVACNTKNIYENIKVKKYASPIIENYEKKDIILSLTNNKKIKEISFKKKYILNGFKNNNINSFNVNILNSKIYAINKNIELLIFDFITGKLISSIKIKTLNDHDKKISSFNYLDNFFIIGFKSGLIIKINNEGDIIWEFKSDKILNTSITIFENQLIALYVDEIKSISMETGKVIWSEVYEDLPLYQAKGGQLVNFLNLLYFILPNNKIGSIDLHLGIQHNSRFNEIPLISSINNINDKIHIFENYLVYLDEGKYLYTFDILLNDFILFKHDINHSSSNIFFNNSLILKEGNYLQAINIINGKTFWLIDENIDKKSTIKNVLNTDNTINIFLSNGDILNINNNELIKINNIGVSNIDKISFQNETILLNTLSGNTVVF